MRGLFPGRSAVRAWHKRVLGADPFTGDARTAAASFFLPALRLCRRPVPAEKDLPSSIPPALRRRLAMALRLWQASQEITLRYVRGGALPQGMDKPMTLNFAMALGNYSRYFLFSGVRLNPRQSIAVHAAFAGEMASMPAAMSLSRKSGFTPEASARRLARAVAAALETR